MRCLRSFMLLCTLAGSLAAMAQDVTDEQYKAANAAITPEATYLIFTLNNGEGEGSTRYYLTDNGQLTAAVAAAGRFTFHRTEGDNLYRSPGWQVEQAFTNPNVSNSGVGEIYYYGYIRTNDARRPDYEGQVWYKQGETFAVRSTNAPGTSWGANTFWGVERQSKDATALPNAEYSLIPQFTWRLEKINGVPDPVDPSAKEVNRLTNLPHVYLNTFTGRDITSKTEYVLARMWYVYENDSVAFYDSLQVRGRGNSTWGLTKKPYKIKFKQKEKFLGKGYAKTKKWTMLANHGDKSLIRNAVTMAMGERVGLKFNPAAKFVDLTLNDRYVGNYQLSDQIDVRPHRVNITEQDYPLAEGADITGGYLFEADGSGDFHTYDYWDSEAQRTLPPDGFRTEGYNVPVRIHYPDADELEQQQVDYAMNFINEFEERLYGDNFSLATEGYRPYVDSLSLANWYLCTEMSGNVDGMYSTYFYKDAQDNHIFWGPLWDYDIAYNNDYRTDRWEGNSNTERQLMTYASYGSVKFWMQRMWQDPWFARLINRRYKEVLDAGIEDYLNQKIDSLVDLLDASVQLNYQRWGISSRTLRERVLYSTYDEYIADLRTYINKHFAYLKTAFVDMNPGGTVDPEPDPEPQPDPDPEPQPDPDPEPDPEPQPRQPDFAADSLLYYGIFNAGSSTYLDVATESDNIVCNARDDEAVSQKWRIYPLANGYLYIENALNGRALNDPTKGEPTATTLQGTQLNTAPADSLDVRQQWDFVAQGDEWFNLISRFSQHAANLSGGNAANGTPVLSYTSDDRNAESTNRMWRIVEIGKVVTPEPDPDPEPEPDPDPDPDPNPDPEPQPDPAPDPDAVNNVSVDYALAYNAHTGQLHFGSDNLEALTFNVRVFDQAGHLVLSFRACDGASLANLPHGVYVITWQWQGRKRVTKLIR